MAELNALGSTFFKGVKKQVRLEAYEQLETKADEKRKKLFLSLELNVDTVGGMPGWLADTYQLLNAKNTHAERMTFAKSTDMPGMTIESWDTPESKHRHLLLTGCDFKKFVVYRVGIAEAARFWMEWTVYVKDSTELHKWCRQYFREDVFMAFEQGQMELGLSDDDHVGDPAHQGENRDTMNPARDAEFATSGTKANKRAVQ